MNEDENKEKNMATSIGVRSCIRVLGLPRFCSPAINQISNQRIQRVSTETSAQSNNVNKEADIAESTQKDTENQQNASAVNEVEKQLKEEKAKLETQVKQITDKYKRALAETENVRSRFQKQLADSRLYSIQGFCKDLLEVADILGAATTSVPKEEVNGNGVNPHLKSLYQGLTMTESQLQKVFSKNHMQQINPVGEKFDPNFHEALFEAVVEGKAAGTVTVVTKIGYKLHERTIRPALVGVAKAS